MSLYTDTVFDKNGEEYYLIVDSTDGLFEGSLYKVGYRSGEKVAEDYVGFFTMSILIVESDSMYVDNYGIKEAYRGKGLGSVLVDESKTFAKKLGFKHIKLRKLRREVEDKTNKLKKVDANLMLYLKHGFKLDKKEGSYGFQSAIMICDLYEDYGLTQEEINQRRLENKEEALRIMGQVDQAYYEEQKKRSKYTAVATSETFKSCRYSNKMK